MHSGLILFRNLFVDRGEVTYSENNQILYSLNCMIMKTFFAQLFSILIFCLIITSCNNENENPVLVGEWILIEQLADPGDGSGTFQPVNSSKTLEFYSDSTIVCNGQMCQLSTESSPQTNGTYSPTFHTITPENCPVSFFPLTYEMQGQYLILNYPCIEACREKYEQVD